MSRAYRVRFQTQDGDFITTIGFGNTRTSAERSARRKLPAFERRTAHALGFAFVPEEER